MKLEICTDASIRAFENRRVFGCAGAICINTEALILQVTGLNY